MSRYDAVLFDAYGTLVELDQPFGRLRRALRSRLGVDADAATVERAFRAEMEYYAANCQRGADSASLRELREDCARVLLAELGVDRDAGAAAESLMESIRFRVFADVAPTLAGLRRRGLRTAAVSNWDMSLPAVLRGAGVELDEVVASASAGASKPDPAIFTRALRRLGVSPERALHVGDTPAADAAGARAAGVDVRILRREGVGSDRGGDGTIAALTDLLELVA